MLSPQKNAYSLVDIFCGAGGLSKGLKMSGFFEPVAGVELNADASDTYRKNFPSAEVLQTEVMNMTGKQLLKIARNKGHRRVDALCGGPPCKPFSQANKGKTHWKFIKKIKKIAFHPDWENFLRLVRELDPLFVIAENVMGFRTNREVFLPFVEQLKEMGYTVASPLLDASKFGIPQKRMRIIILALKGDFDPNELEPSPTIHEPNYVCDAIFDLPPLTNKNVGTYKSSYIGKILPPYAKKLRKNKQTLYNHQTHSVHPVMQKRFVHIPPGYNLKKAWEEGKIPKKILKSSYELMGRKRRYSLKALEQIHSNIYRKLRWKKLSPTLTHPRKTVIIHPTQNRLLSVRECARLQSFPDNFVFTGTMNQQYQQIADAVPPLLAQAIGSNIAKLWIKRTTKFKKVSV